MAVNPTEWLSSTMEACCKKFFGGYNYDSCMGRYPPDHDDCNVMLYYPDWNGANKGCIDDGKTRYCSNLLCTCACCFVSKSDFSHMSSCTIYIKLTQAKSPPTC